MNLAALVFIAAHAQGPIQITDVYGRDVTDRGIVLTEWDGQIANPEIPLQIHIPATLSASDIFVHGTNPRIQFDKADREDRYGLARRIRLSPGATSADFKVSIFPERADTPEQPQQLWFQVVDKTRKELARASIPVRIWDRRKPALGPCYPIIVDFSRDQTGIFKSKEMRDIVRQAAADWSYFIADQGEDFTPAGDEVSEMWGTDGFNVSSKIKNDRGYKGYLLYVAGIDFPEWRSGGAPSPYGKLQTAGGKTLPLRRSGTVSVETAGNYNRLGWFLTRGSDDWWLSGNQRNEQSDLYSIMLHEIGHAIAFHPDYPNFGAAKAAGTFASPLLIGYFGHAPNISATDHFPGLIDPVSGYGCFGNEYEGTAKSRRWMISKGNLIGLQAVGYKLRKTAAFDTLHAERFSYAFTWRAGSAAAGQLKVQGGVPEYDYSIEDGSLPPGTALDSFTGHISGTPQAAGQYDVHVKIADNDPTTHPLTVAVHIVVQ